MIARALLLIASTSVLLQGTALADPTALKDTVPHITTLGMAKTEIVPDQADLFLGVDNEKPTAAAATQATAEAADRVIDEIKTRGIAAKDIKTGFNLFAQYNEEFDKAGHSIKKTLRSYRAKETITVRLHDTAKAGDLARAFIEKGANEFSGISFSYSKDEAARKSLKADAIRSALADAKAYTDALGLKLGRVLLIGDEASQGDFADLPARKVEAKTAIAIPTEPGVQEISESISVVWEIEGKVP